MNLKVVKLVGEKKHITPIDALANKRATFKLLDD